MDMPHFFCSLVDGHLDCFYILSVINNAVNIHELFFVCTHLKKNFVILLRYIASSGIAGLNIFF